MDSTTLYGPSIHSLGNTSILCYKCVCASLPPSLLELLEWGEIRIVLQHAGMHTRNVFGNITLVPPEDCGSSCLYQLNMVGRVAGEVEEINATTYQYGELYYCKYRVRMCLSPLCSNCVSPPYMCTHHVQYN